MRRSPVFSLKRKQVIARCRKSGKPMICAGQVLALMSLMKHRGWTMLELADHSHVGRSTISKILSLQMCPTSVIWWKLAFTCGQELYEFDLMAAFEVKAEVSSSGHRRRG